MAQDRQRWFERREVWTSQEEDARDAGAVDYARVIHSASFRRLQGKTQILNLGDGDFYRTRLTHSLEVAQIASGIVRQLQKNVPDHPATAQLPDASLIQAIALTHDLGHPPFGHGGEVALNYCMREDGGFEGNGQTLRILARLEKFSEAAGSNLTRRSLLGVLKYPVPYSRVNNPKRAPCLMRGTTTVSIIDRSVSKPPKCYFDTEEEVVGWILDPLSPADRDLFQTTDARAGKHGEARYKSFDCSIMDLADDIAFGVHDLEDALALRLIDEAQFRAGVGEASAASFLDALKAKYPGESDNDVYETMVRGLFADGGQRKRFISRMVHHLITNVVIHADDAFEEPMLRYRAAVHEAPGRFLGALKDVVLNEVIRSAAVQQLEFKGQKMVVDVFETLRSDPKSFLSPATRALHEAAGGSPRVISDHIAGMTDGFLLKTYDRLFSPRTGSIFDRL
ncbi:MAG TPA: anti-phage deoxyguanosine triphosphatase [Allosphingosinicella sp.]|nr:anti-phage deoxyguanosine triphosphatase [Allosphingosinicella sp.]